MLVGETNTAVQQPPTQPEQKTPERVVPEVTAPHVEQTAKPSETTGLSPEQPRDIEISAVKEGTPQKVDHTGVPKPSITSPPANKEATPVKEVSPVPVQAAKPAEEAPQPVATPVKITGKEEKAPVQEEVAPAPAPGTFASIHGYMSLVEKVEEVAVAPPVEVAPAPQVEETKEAAPAPVQAPAETPEEPKEVAQEAEAEQGEKEAEEEPAQKTGGGKKKKKNKKKN